MRIRLTKKWIIRAHKKWWVVAGHAGLAKMSVSAHGVPLWRGYPDLACINAVASMAVIGVVLCLGILFYYKPGATADVPTPKIWPTRFHALLVQNFSGQLGVMDLWYDWAKGGNLHIIQNQLVGASYDMEWNNGTSFFYDLKAKTCSTVSVGVGILRPDWLHDANYLGVQEVDGFTCNVWEKLDFITYYEDVETKRPVYWVFYTGRKVHIITFEEGVYLQEDVWQAPTYCFKDEQTSLADSALLHGRTKGQGLTDSYKDWLLSGAMSA